MHTVPVRVSCSTYPSSAQRNIVSVIRVSISKTSANRNKTFDAREGIEYNTIRVVRIVCKCMREDVSDGAWYSVGERKEGTEIFRGNEEVSKRGRELSNSKLSLHRINSASSHLSHSEMATG
jgi:hypothetical protein